MKHRLRLGDEEYEVELEEGGDHLLARIDGVEHELRLEQIDASAEYSLIIDGRPYQLFAEESPHGFEVLIDRHAYSIGATRMARPATSISAEMTAAQSLDEEWVLVSPMAGVVQKVLVAPDDVVEAGAVLMVIEAMKMQNELHARRSGQVKAVYVTVGQQVEPGTPLVVLL